MKARARTCLWATLLVAGCRSLPAATPLAAEVPATGEVSGESPAYYQITVPAEQALEVEATAEIDVKLYLTDRRGEVLIEENRTAATDARESLFYVTRKPERLRIRVESNLPATPPGTIELVAHVRAAQPGDEARGNALLLLQDARHRSVQAGDLLADAPGIARRAVEAFEAVGDERRLAEALATEGRIHDLLGHPTQSREARQRALALYEKLGDDAGRAQCLYGIANLDHDRGDHTHAIAGYEAAVAAAEKSGDAILQAKALHNIGGVHLALDEWQDALDYLERAERVFDSVGGWPQQPYTWVGIGQIYHRLGNAAEARKQYERALAALREVDAKWDEADALTSLAYLALEVEDDAPRARSLFEEALTAATEAGSPIGRAGALTGLGLTQERLGALGDAEGSLQSALALYTETDTILGRAETLQVLGRVHLALGENERGMAELQESIQLSDRLQARRVEAAARYEVARFHHRQGDTELARREVAHAIALVEDIRAGIVEKELRATYLASVRQYYDLQIQLLMEAGRTQDALVASERAKARSLLETLTSAGAERAGPMKPELAERLRAETRSLKSAQLHYADLVAQRATPEDVQVASKTLADALQRYQDAEAAARAGSGRYAQLSAPPRLDVQALQRKLPAGSALLAYHLGDAHGWVWVVDRRSVRGTALPAAPAIETQVRALYEAITARNQTPAGESAQQKVERVAAADESAARAAEALSHSVLDPVGPHLPTQRIYVLPDGPLQYVPFAALPAPGDASAAPLVERVEVVRLASAAVFLALQRHRSNRSKKPRVAILADPVFHADDPRVTGDTAAVSESGDVRGGWVVGSAGAALPRLRFSRVEAQAIAALVPDDRRWVGLDFDANRDAVLSDRMARFDLVHFAVHGTLDTEHPDLSSLVLSLVDDQGHPEDGYLRLHDIYGLDWHADLVVLSACETALGRHVRGEGLIGLTRGFLYAGAGSVASSLWQVHDRGTAELMTRLYSGMLRDGLPPPTALRRAQLQLRASERWSSPYYWAPFVLND